MSVQATIWEDLVLLALRSRPTGKGHTASTLCDRLRLLETPEERASVPVSVQSALDNLEARGDVRRVRRAGLELTESGRARAADLLGTDRAPPAISWDKLISGFVCARALDYPPDALPAERERLAKVDGLRAEIIRDHFELPLRRAPALRELRGAMGWRLLSRGVPQEIVEQATARRQAFTVQLVTDALMYAAAGRAGVEAGRGPAVLAAKLVGAESDSAEALYRAVVWRYLRASIPARGLATAARPPDEASSPGEAATASGDFVAAVLAAARASKDGWFDEQRVFISHVWRRLPEQGVDLSLEALKARLLDEHRARRILLGRAELPQVMDPVDLAESRIEDRSFTFVFIKIPALEARA